MNNAAEIRETFLSYFESKGHQRVASGPLIPEDDPTLLFTNAGMNQFKDVFLGRDQRDYKRATSSQKCMRVSGKHNDLETVGRTARHHTFFEMLGNFSFADYFKKEAIEYAWDLCTSVYGLSVDRLFITVFREDEEALSIWRDLIGIPQERLLKMGEEDNYWSMGDTGPCGPCSELHYDLGTSPLGHADCTVDCDCGRFVEIWNLVFMQYNRDASGAVTPLPSPSIDTGMGLERIACVLQGVQSNYQTDLFRPLIEEACRLTGVTYGEDEKKDVSLRILADHSRASAFVLSDGVIPGNEGRGYVLRKVLRRAIRHGRMLGMEKPFIYTLTSLVAEMMKDPYPELARSRDYCAKIVKHEEEKFDTTLSHGIQLLDEITAATLKRNNQTLPGKELFRLHDTYGFPLDLARDIAAERGLQVDEDGFKAEMEKQRQRARASWKGEEREVKPIYQTLDEQALETQFTGYTEISDITSQVLTMVQGEEVVEEASENQTAEVILDRSPFYAEAGGQVADTGRLENDRLQASLEDVFTPLKGLRVHRIKIGRGQLRKGDLVHCTVSAGERYSTARNHTATHLLHASLREVLGEHVKQSGSLVAPERLRFDFTHYRAVSHRELRDIEELVNRKIRDNTEIQTDVRDLDQAIQEGAMALFGEKYQRRVRVVKVPGFSMELCGGTHVRRTGDIALFKIVQESSISAGVRRVEAISGEMALNRFLDDDSFIASLGDELHVPRTELPSAVEKMAQELRDARRQIEGLRLKIAQQDSGDVLDAAREVKGIPVLSERVENLDRKALRQLADRFRRQLKTGIVVLGTPSDGKVSLVAMVTPDLTDRIKASDLIQKIAVLVKGGGGGKADMAEAGGKDPSRLSEALEQTYRLVEELLQ